MTCCTLGSRADIETITKAMLPVDQGGEGLTVRAVAERFGVKRYLVERHWGCLKAQGVMPDRTKPPVRREPQSERRPKAEALPQTDPQTSSQTEPAEAQTDTDSEKAAVDTLSDSARARSSDDATDATFRARAWHIADLIADAKYEGRKTNIELAKQWGITLDAVQRYARTASMMVSKDRNSLEVQREVSLAKIASIRERALEGTRPFECPKCEEWIDVPNADYKAAVLAQKHADEISGVCLKTGINININNPVYDAIWGIVSRVLMAEDAHGVQKYPGALEAVEHGVQRYLAARRGEMRVIDVPALAAAS
jgi:hypothetical protein